MRDLYLKQEGISAAVEGHFTILNGIGRMKQSRKQMISYLLYNCRYTAYSDQRKEGIVSGAVNEFSGSLADEILTILTLSNSVVPASEIQVERKPLAEIYRGVTRSAHRSIESELLHFRRSLGRRFQRDVERVRQYYGTLIAEIEARIHRKGLTGKEKQAELQRIQAIQLELKKKLLDQKERYAIDVKAQLLSAMRIYLNVLVVVYEVQRKQRVREVVFSVFLLVVYLYAELLGTVSCPSVLRHTAEDAHFPGDLSTAAGVIQE